MRRTTGPARQKAWLNTVKHCVAHMGSVMAHMHMTLVVVLLGLRPYRVLLYFFVWC